MASINSIDFLPQIDFTSRDYESIKSSLVKYVQRYFPNDVTDFSEGGLGAIILEMIAYVGDQLSFYLDRQANEMFLPTATQRDSVINLVTLIGYVPRSTSAAVAPIRATLNIAQVDPTVFGPYINFIDKQGNQWEFLDTITIPAGRVDTFGIIVNNEVLGLGDGSTRNFNFLIDNDNINSTGVVVKTTIASVLYQIAVRADGTIPVPFGGTGEVDFVTGSVTLNFVAGHVPDNASQLLISYTYNQNIKAYQGVTKLDVFASDGSPDQEFVLSNSPVLISARVEEMEIFPNPNRFEVWVGDPGAPFGNETGTLWQRVDSLATAGPTENVYSIRFDDQDSLIVEFGDGSAGAAPPAGIDNISVIYRVGGGTKGNVSTNFIDSSVSAQSGLLALTVDIKNYQSATGGRERESLNEIRVNAPAFLKTNDTATTEQDFDTLSLFTRSGMGTVARAKSRLTPSLIVTTKTIHTAESLAVIPVGAPTEYFLLIPATPMLVDTIIITYVVGGVTRTITANDLGGGLADFTGDGTLDPSSRIRYDEQNFVDEVFGFGNGVTTLFSGTLGGFPVLPGRVIFTYFIGGVEHVGYDDGSGNLIGVSLNASTIDYENGDVDLDYSTAPDAASAIVFDYQSCLHLVLTTAPTVGSEILISAESGPTEKEFPTNNIEVYTWALDADGNLVAPTDALKDNLKNFLDLRRVLATSVEIKNGFNVRVHYTMEVVFDPSINQSETIDRIITALEDYFSSEVDVIPGRDVPIAAIYDAIFPLQGLVTVTITEVGIRVPVGTGDSLMSVFKNSVDPGEQVSAEKLPAKTGSGKIKVYRDNTEIGSSDAGTPTVNLTGSEVIAGSTFNKTTGAFDLRINPAPAKGEVIGIDFLLDDDTDPTLWNVNANEWEIAVLGSIIINGIQVR